MARLAWVAFGGVLSVATIAAGVGVWAFGQYEKPGPLAEDTTVVIPRGTSLKTITELLQDAGVVPAPLIAEIGARIEGIGGSLQAGEYHFPAHVSARAAMKILRSGRTVARRVTVPEGLTVKQVMALLAHEEGLRGEAGEPPTEGSLLPETYYVSLGDRRADVIARMQDGMKGVLEEMWQKRAPDLPLTSPQEALILASIVEKEAGSDAEKPVIAGVFLNRLRRGMPLQADPTVLYAVTGGEGRLDRPLTQQDLQYPSPYNTYLVTGLPPGPIANPGRESLEAVLHPVETDALYFVANGSGGHAFARTLDEHNRNVAAWRKLVRGNGAKPN